MSLTSKFKHIQFELIPREQNYEADKLSYRAYEEIVYKRRTVDIRYEQP
jgi:hypothetical protein